MKLLKKVKTNFKVYPVLYIKLNVHVVLVGVICNLVYKTFVQFHFIKFYLLMFYIYIFVFIFKK